MIQKNDDDVNQKLLIDTLNYIYDNGIPDNAELHLSAISERDKVWDSHRSDTQSVSDIYKNTQFHQYSERMSFCSPYLDFAIDAEKGLKLKRSFFCHVRNCPVCQWRKSLYWKAMMYKTYDKIKDDYQDYRWLFLTLTVKNCHISDLRDTIKQMSNAFVRLTKRKEFANVAGFVRTTEVTRDKKNPYTHAHPHFHCMLLVSPKYFFGGNYIKHADWVKIWAECLKVNYAPNVDIRAVKSKSDEFALRDVIAETLKYACKPSDMIYDNTQQAQQWFIEYTNQVHKMRFVNSGGVLKNALKSEKDITNDDMIALSDDVNTDDTTDKRLLSFSYYSTKRSYIYNHKNNK